MKAAAAAFALVAMLPAMAEGALAHAAGGEGIVLALCSGASMVINSGSPDTPRPANAPCCAKGCRDNERRRKTATGGIDPAQ